VDPKELIEQLRGIRCLSTARARKKNDSVNVLSCPDAIVRAIEEALAEPSGTAEQQYEKACPDCGHPLVNEAGCRVCKNCGYSKCG